MSYRGNCPQHGPHFEEFCQECPQKLKSEPLDNYGRGPAMQVLDEQRAKYQEKEDDLRDQIANGGC